MIRTFSIFALLLAGTAATAQQLPTELHGRWTLAARGVSQTFALENIERKDDGSFAARLTWWTINSRCTVRDEPITGRITPTGLSFDAKTHCGDAFTAELARGEGGWTGKAVAQNGSVELTAK